MENHLDEMGQTNRHRPTSRTIDIVNVPLSPKQISRARSLPFKDRSRSQHWKVNEAALDENDEAENDDESHLCDSNTNTVIMSKAYWKNAVVNFLALTIPIIFPICHMFIFTILWGSWKTPVDTQKCSSSCWDAIFKGPYDAGGNVGYKHVYFNSNSNTLKMWILTATGIVALYEGFKRLFALLWIKKLRWTMGVLFLISLHSHYYGWWNYWNYWNDDFYDQWYHQLLFTVTELVSTIIVVSFFDARHAIKPIPMIVVCTIASVHVLFSGWDQFVSNIIRAEGELHQFLRDMVLMMTDITQIALSLYEMRVCAHERGMSLFSVIAQRKNILVAPILFVIMWIWFINFP